LDAEAFAFLIFSIASFSLRFRFFVFSAFSASSATSAATASAIASSISAVLSSAAPSPAVPSWSACRLRLS
jgi:hypothetical protein